MCGIAGALSTRPNADLRPLVGRIVEHQRPRGPDAQSTIGIPGDDLEVVLGHDRLSIIDLSVDANQPMSNDPGDLRVVFNGEIYNFVELRDELVALGAKFRTRSDTEVILAAYREWGSDAFARFVGMFAIALYDSLTQELVLVRDRFGVKPLYYWHDRTRLVFASTPTVIAEWAQLPPNIDYVARGIRLKYYEDDSDMAPYAGVQSLESSHVLHVRRSVHGDLHLAKTRYYDVAAMARATAERLEDLAPSELEPRLLELLRSACLLRQRCDVPLGLSVSGGVDSSAIAALLSETTNGIIGYSFSHPDDPSSEGPLVAELARASKLIPRYVTVNGRDEIIELFWRTLRAQDAPFPHVTVMAQHAVFRAARADGTVVLLGGQGGDEAFMGYRKFFLFYAQSVARERRVADVPHVLGALLPLVPPVLKRAGLFLSERKRYSSGEGMGSRLRLPANGTDGGMGLAGRDGLFERQVLDITRFSLPTLLRYEDRNSMGSSIESRLPFMDQRIVEFGLALSPRYKIGNGFGKLILRRALRGKVPDSILRNRDKRGFDVDQRAWLAAGLADELRFALRQRQSAIDDFLPAGESVATLFSDQRFDRDPQAFKEAVSLIWLGDRR
jgi:asparagine synthase (glutamine-hydrolysing)